MLTEIRTRKRGLRTIRIPGNTARRKRIERGASILARTVLAGTSAGIKEEEHEPFESRAVQIYQPGRHLARIQRGDICVLPVREAGRMWDSGCSPKIERQKQVEMGRRT